MGVGSGGTQSSSVEYETITTSVVSDLRAQDPTAAPLQNIPTQILIPSQGLELAVDEIGIDRDLFAAAVAG